MRAQNSLRNMITGMVGRLLYMVLSFVTRTVFIATLTEEYLGINGLLVSILSMLALAELGIGGAIDYAMYKPVAENDLDKIKSLLRLFRAAYRIVGITVLAVGFAITPFVPYLAKATTELVDLRIVFVLYLMEMASSYLFFAYYSSVLYANQKSYVETLISYPVTIVSTVLKILVLVLLRKTPMLSFYCYAFSGVVTNILQAVLVRWKVRQMYPWTRDLRAEPLPKEERTAIFKNVAGLFTNKICRVLNDGIDNTIISAYIGLAAVGVYSNYLLLRTYVTRILSTVFSSMTAGIGNICAIESQEKKEDFFKALDFTYFWIYGFCSICFWTLYNSFLAGVWLHDTKWLLPDITVFLVVFNFLLQGMTEAVGKYRDVNGLYWHTRYRYIFSSVFNAVLSVVLVGPLKMGVTGALLGTTVSILIMISFDPVLVYREVFHKSAAEYYRSYGLHLLLVLATGGAVHLASLPFSAYTLPNFLARMAICLVVPNGLWYLLFRKDPRFVYLRDMVLNLLRGIVRRLSRKKDAEA